jgi:selenocysteine-specific elongation factor
VAPPEAERLQLSAGRTTVELGGWIVAKEYRDRLIRQIRELAGAPGGVRIDELASKLRGEPQALLPMIAGQLVEAEQLSLRGAVLFTAGVEEPKVSPMGRQLLRDLASGGNRGLELNKLKIAGARKELRNLVRADLAVALDGDIYYEKQIYLALVRSCLADLRIGGILTIAQTKERTQLSRKYAIPLLNRMERDGFVKRSGDERVVTAKP